MLNVHRPHKVYQGWGEGGERGMEMGREVDYIPIVHCHHQNDSSFKMGSDESHFNVSLIVRDKVTRQCAHKPQPFSREGKEPKQNRAEALLNISLTPYR